MIKLNNFLKNKNLFNKHLCKFSVKAEIRRFNQIKEVFNLKHEFPVIIIKNDIEFDKNNVYLIAEQNDFTTLGISDKISVFQNIRNNFLLLTTGLINITLPIISLYAYNFFLPQDKELFSKSKNYFFIEKIYLCKCLKKVLLKTKNDPYLKSFYISDFYYKPPTNENVLTHYLEINIKSDLHLIHWNIDIYDLDLFTAIINGYKINIETDTNTKIKYEKLFTEDNLKFYSDNKIL